VLIAALRTSIDLLVGGWIFPTMRNQQPIISVRNDFSINFQSATVTVSTRN
jgi:hypothetical protein